MKMSLCCQTNISVKSTHKSEYSTWIPSTTPSNNRSNAHNTQNKSVSKNGPQPTIYQRRMAPTGSKALSRLSTLGQAVGDDEGLEVEVIDVEQEVGKGKAKDAEGE